ncbi:MAG: excinuclease ABC subunit UvrA [Bacteroidaceae bacterium]|nr:excinuclease ABC subunit UvrA [Bacteroidaceae bacterium]
MSSTDGTITILGARVHNLKNIDVEIPRCSLTVITGLSGSGKSSLAFDTIFAEGQRRYIETFSAYARNFLGNLERPDVDMISGLSPVISIEQKTTNKNPRSTVGTSTEIYDFLRLLFARVGEAYSYVTGEKMVKYTEEQILDLLLRDFSGKKVYLLAPLIKNRKGHYKELFDSIRRKGYLYVRVDGAIQEIVNGMKVDRYKNHDIEVVVDRLVIQEKDDKRLVQSISTAMKLGDGEMLVYDFDTNEIRHYSRRLMCPTSGISYSDPAPHDFSFNSPRGACPRCKGLGYVSLIDVDKVIPDRSLSVKEGGIAPLGKLRQAMIFWEIQAILQNYDCTLETPLSQVPEDAIDEIINGSSERLRIPSEIIHATNDYYVVYEGLVKFIQQMQDSEVSASAQKWAEQFSRTAECPECCGKRLNKQALHFRIADKNIAEVAEMDLSELYEWVLSVNDILSDRRRKIAPEILKEIRVRLSFLLDVGLDYLSLSRSSMSLSGGESQRIRLATQIGSQLVNVLYILDEPSIGLHQRDNIRLINSLKALRDTGNTIIVVEHDQEMMENADYIVDIGPQAGRRGGEVVFQGTYKNMLKRDTLTSKYLKGTLRIEVPAERRKGNEKSIWLRGAHGNNLKNVDVEIPLGTLICVTGVSGSGKSTLINDTLQPILSQHFYRSLRDPLPYDSIEGLDNIDKVVNVDQSPLGRTPRSNPATYTGIFNDIRSLFVELPEARIRGYKPGRFSFNVKGGRCEACSGNGYKTIEMNFLPDVYVPCEECHGKRYNRETLEVRFRGKSIADVLDMTINQAVEFFENQPVILNKIKVLQDIGLGYVKLGQPSTTLSGGESQRVKLATELGKRETGKTLYILDEPTTGLHFEDIRVLLDVLNRLVDRGNTVIVIEHNMDVVKCADWLIDMGPDGGRGGGKLIFEGTPEQLVASKKGYTAKYLKKMLK